MTIISKTALAAELKVSKARVSQYTKAGLPVRADGKIDRETALNWVALNLRSGAHHDKGPARARELEAVPSHVVGDAEAARRAIVGFGNAVLFYAGSTAVNIGLPMRTTFALLAELAEGLDDLADAQMQRFRVPGRAHLVSLAQGITPDDWTTFANTADEPVDLAAWQAHHAEVHAKLYPEFSYDEDERSDPAPSDTTPEQ